MFPNDGGRTDLPARGARRRVGRTVALGVAALGLLLTAACTGIAHSDANGTPGASASKTPAPEPTVTFRGKPAGVKAARVTYRKKVRIGVDDGTFVSVRVDGVKTEHHLNGEVAADAKSWVSETLPKPSSVYAVVAKIKDADGAVKTKTAKFRVGAVPDDQRISFSVTPDDGDTVGIGQAIQVQFTSGAIERRAAVEKAMLVTAKTSAGEAVEGSWHWLNSQVVHWRPKEFWTPGTKVSLDMEIAGVKAGDGRYGRKDYEQTFTIGRSQVTKVDAKTHRVRVYRDGKLVHNWPTGTGKAGLETYSGTYVVLGKAPVVQMDSCSARITCDKKDPGYYDEKEYWATRVTASGTFLHAAGWDPLMGRANTSHGCIHLPDADAKNFYEHANVGDVVIVSNSGRGPQERIATQDPGLYDWNLSWAKWKAGSALH